MKPNMNLRYYARGKGVAIWQVAERYAVHENTLLLWLRKTFSMEASEKFCKIVDQIAEEQARGEKQ